MRRGRETTPRPAEMLELFSYVKVLADLYIIYSNDENERLCALTVQINFRVGK